MLWKVGGLHVVPELDLMIYIIHQMGTPQHVLVDASELNPSKTEIWQGKSLVVPVRLNLLSEAYRQGLQQPTGGGLSYAE